MLYVDISIVFSESRDHWALNGAQSLLSNIFLGGSIKSQDLSNDVPNGQGT